MQLLHTAHVPAGAGPFPTLIALHGWGASAHDLLGLAPHLHGGGMLVLCPQGPVRVPIAPGLEGYGWFPLDPEQPLELRDFEKGAELLRDFVDAALARYPVERRKLVMLGFSQGGVMAYDMVLRDPARFAGLIALSSWLPEALAAKIPRQPEHAGFPVLVEHGSEDPLIDVALGRESRDTLLRFGVALGYREYEMGHEIQAEGLRDLRDWLEAKVLHPIQIA